MMAKMLTCLSRNIGFSRQYYSVSELGPGKAVRYQAEVVATNKLKNGVADFNISFSNGDQLYTVSTFQIQTRKR